MKMYETPKVAFVTIEVTDIIQASGPDTLNTKGVNVGDTSGSLIFELFNSKVE